MNCKTSCFLLVVLATLAVSVLHDDSIAEYNTQSKNGGEFSDEDRAEIIKGARAAGDPITSVEQVGHRADGKLYYFVRTRRYPNGGWSTDGNMPTYAAAAAISAVQLNGGSIHATFHYASITYVDGIGWFNGVTHIYLN